MSMSWQTQASNEPEFLACFNADFDRLRLADVVLPDKKGRPQATSCKP